MLYKDDKEESTKILNSVLGGQKGEKKFLRNLKISRILITTGFIGFGIFYSSIGNWSGYFGIGIGVIMFFMYTHLIKLSKERLISYVDLVNRAAKLVKGSYRITETDDEKLT